MPRGFVWAFYLSDDGFTYALRVDADYAGQPERGWQTDVPPGTVIYPRGWRARRVRGVDELGAIREALVGTVDCDLWTGVATSFTLSGSDGAPHTCTVIERQAERMTPRPS